MDEQDKSDWTPPPAPRRPTIRDLLTRARPSMDVEHRFRIDDAAERPSTQGTGYDVIHLALRVVASAEEGRRIRVRITMTELGEAQLVDLLEAVGYDDADAEWDPRLLVGREFYALLEEEGGFPRLVDIHAVDAAP